MESHMSSTLHEANEENDSLHVAARSGQKEIVLQILRRHSSLIYHRNMKGDIPLHVAAGAGHLGIVELLTRFHLRSAPSTENDSTIDMLENGATPFWRTENEDGSTPLHEALRNKHEDIALHLLDLDLDRRLTVLANSDHGSPLYLAAKAGFVCVLNKILEAGGHPSTVGPNGQTPFHAAVFAKSQESIRILYGSFPALIKIQDSYGKTALHYATEVDSLEIIRVLLELDPSTTSIYDNKGFTLLLVAVRKGRSASLRAILDACPAKSKKELINKPDQQGNTPLHLATMGQKYEHVLVLLSSKLVDFEIKNEAGKTALDLCSSDSDLSERQILIQDALQYRPSNPLIRLILALYPKSTRKMVEATPDERLSDMMNMAGVVAALLASVTFAACFQVPGGYNSNDGSPVLVGNLNFLSFVRVNAVSFCLSMLALYYLIMAAIFGAEKISPSKALTLAMSCLILALMCTIYAFGDGTIAVMPIEAGSVATFVSTIRWIMIVLFFVLGCVGRLYFDD